MNETRDSECASGAFSLLMAIYAGDGADYLRVALESVFQSTHLPAQVVLVQDGPVPVELAAVVERYSTSLPIELIVLPSNLGLGVALQHGLTHCRHDLVARFDSDDILVPDRFELQMSYFADHPETSLLGGWIREFDDKAISSTRLRKVPLSAASVARYARMRNPMNHMTVMFRKSAVLAAGSYQDQRGYEDYALWARMLTRGAKLVNLPVVMVHARAGSAMLNRRGGFKYAQLEWRLQSTLYDCGLIGRPEFLRNLMLRVPPRLVPASIRSAIYKYLLRTNTE